MSLFVYAILTIAVIGRLGVWRGSNRNANDSYYKSSADAWALRARTLETVEHVVVNTHPAAIGAAHSTHVHLPTGGYLCAWVAPRSKSEASRPAVWASRRLPIGESSDSSTKWWSDPFVLARAPGTPNTHEKPALFFVHDVLHLHFMVRDAGWEGHGAADAFETVSTDFGDTWSAVVAIETASVDAGATPGLPKVLGSCAVGGSLVRKPLNGEKGGFQVTCLGDFFLNEEKSAAVPVLIAETTKLKSSDTVNWRLAGFAKGPSNLSPMSASVWRHPLVKGDGGKHTTRVVFLMSDGHTYRSDSVDGGSTNWSPPARVDAANFDTPAVSTGGVSAARVGRRAVVLSRVFFDTSTKITVVRLSVSDDGGDTFSWRKDLDVAGGGVFSFRRRRRELRRRRCRNKQFGGNKQFRGVRRSRRRALAQRHGGVYRDLRVGIVRGGYSLCREQHRRVQTNRGGGEG